MDIVAQRSIAIKRDGAAPILWAAHQEAEYYCSTTGQWYRPLSFRYMVAEDRVCAWVFCPLCDGHARKRGDAGYDPTDPQPHLYMFTQVPPRDVEALRRRIQASGV